MHIIKYKSRLQCVYLQNHDMGICSITCDAITTLRLPEEVCLCTTNRAHKYTHSHTVLSAGFVLQSHVIYTLGPAGLCSSSMSFLQAAEEREKERRGGGGNRQPAIWVLLHWMQSPW